MQGVGVSQVEFTNMFFPPLALLAVPSIILYKGDFFFVILFT